MALIALLSPLMLAPAARAAGPAEAPPATSPNAGTKPVPAATPRATAAPGQPATPDRPAAPARGVPATASPAVARPGSDVRVIEDDQVRIEETRVRGQLQRVTVAPKGSRMGPYQINVGAGGRDPSQDKSAAGQRVWSVLQF